MSTQPNITMSKTMSATITIKGIESPTASEAVQHTESRGFGKAIQIGGKNIVVDEAEARRLESEGHAFSYLHVKDHPNHPCGVLVSVPVLHARDGRRFQICIT